MFFAYRTSHTFILIARSQSKKEAANSRGAFDKPTISLRDAASFLHQSSVASPLSGRPAMQGSLDMTSKTVTAATDPFDCIRSIPHDFSHCQGF